MKTFKLTLATAMLATAVAFGGVTGIDPTGTVTASVAEAHGMGPQSDLRLLLNQLIAEHATLAAAATGAALGGRGKEFQAARRRL